MNLALQRCLRRSHLVEELMEEWQSRNGNSAAYVVQQSLEECEQLVQLLRQTWLAMWDALFASELHDVESPSAVFANILTRTKALLQAIKQKTTTGQPAAPNCHSLLSEVEDIGREFEEKWPRPDVRMAEESRAAFLRGECQTLEEALHAAQSGDFPGSK